MKILHLFLFVLILVSCKNDLKQPAGQQDRETLPTSLTDSVPSSADNAHTSQNSLDWAGEYKGTLPCPDCPALETALTLNRDNTYVLTSQALNKDKEPRVFKGTFTWNDAGQIIILDAEGDHLKFKVQEGCVTLLDKFGDPKQGVGNYILGKKQ